MMQALEDAKEELKRVDHQVYVTLKYTRTVDVLLNTISRMMDGYDYLLVALLKHEQEKEEEAEEAEKEEAEVETLGELPGSPIERGNLVKKLYPDDEQVTDNVELYFLLRKLFRSNPQRENEYRRNVTMRTIIEGREEIVNIDLITNYYHFMIEFYKRVEKIVTGTQGENE